METRTKIIIASLALLTVFAIGRFSSPTKIKTEIKTVEVEKIVTVVEHKTITIREKPDGTKETVIVSDTNTDSKSNSKGTDTTKEVTGSKDKLTISGLIGMNYTAIGAPIYGLSVSKNLLGPIRVGLFGMTDKVAGISLGLDF